MSSATASAATGKLGAGRRLRGAGRGEAGGVWGSRCRASGALSPYFPPVPHPGDHGLPDEDDGNHGVDDPGGDLEARVLRDRGEVPGDRDRVDADHGQPRVFPGAGPEPVAGGREEGDAAHEQQREGALVRDLCRDRAGDGGEVGVELGEAEGGEPDGGCDVGGEQGEQHQEVGEVRGG